MDEIHPGHAAGQFATGDAMDARGPRATIDSPAASRTSLRSALIDLFFHIKLLRNFLLFGCVIGIAGAVLARPDFTADSLILVLVGAESTSTQDLAIASPTVVSIDGLKVVQSEIQIVQTDEVLRAALDAVGVGTVYPSLVKPRWFGLRPPVDAAHQIGEAIQKLRGDLRVDAETGSSIIRLSYTNGNRDIAIRVLQALENAYLSRRKELYATSNLRVLTSELGRYQKTLTSIDQQILDVKAKDQVLDLGQDVVLATNRLDGVVQRQFQVRERRVAVQTEIIAVRANLAQQPATVLDFKETTNNTGNDEARNTLVRLEQERTRLLSLYNPQWPGIVEIDKQIANVRAQMGPAGQNLYFSDRVIRNPALEVLNNRLASLQVEDQALAQQLVELDDQYKQSNERITALREAEDQLHSLQLARDVTEGIYRQLAQRQPSLVIQDNLIDERNANLRIVQPPTAPSIGRSMAISYLLGGIFLGLLSGAAAAVIATLLRRVYIRPDETERDLAVPALAVFDDVTGKTPLDGQPAVAQFASTLQDVTVDGRGLTSLQIMGISEGDDRVDVIRALAVELAVGYERKTLILDLEGDGSAYGTALGLTDDAPATSGPLQLLATRVPRLWVARDAGQSILGNWHTSMSRLHAVFDELHRDFSILLLVAPSDLSRHPVRRIAGLVDANAIIVRAEHTRAPVALQLSDAIRTAGGNMLGFIFVGRKYYIPSWLYRWV
jgi:uncharacterized protein involved in exopolysaccharide biosynthesis